MLAPGYLILSFLGGVGAGIFFFGGLWWTVTKSVSASRPKTLLLLSFFIRLAIVVPVIYWVSGKNGYQLISCLLGFFAARTIILKKFKAEFMHKNIAQKPGDRHAD